MRPGEPQIATPWTHRYGMGGNQGISQGAKRYNATHFCTKLGCSGELWASLGNLARLGADFSLKQVPD